MRVMINQKNGLPTAFVCNCPRGIDTGFGLGIADGQNMRRSRMFSISYFSRSLGKAVTHKFDTIQEAKSVAQSIFASTGIVVGIEAN